MTVLFWEPLYYYHLVCEECGTTGLCSTCAELWESEIDLEDTEAKKNSEKRGSLRGKSGDNLNSIDITSEFEIHKAERVFMAVIQFVGSKW